MSLSHTNLVSEREVFMQQTNTRVMLGIHKMVQFVSQLTHVVSCERLRCVFVQTNHHIFTTYNSPRGRVVARIVPFCALNITPNTTNRLTTTTFLLLLQVTVTFIQTHHLLLSIKVNRMKSNDKSCAFFFGTKIFEEKKN